MPPVQCSLFLLSTAHRVEDALAAAQRQFTPHAVVVVGDNTTDNTEDGQAALLVLVAAVL